MRSGPLCAASRELLIVVLAGFSLIWCLAPHRPAAILATIGLAVPALGVVRSGRLPQRGTIAAASAVIFGAMLTRPTASGIVSWVELATIGLMAITAQVVGRSQDARRAEHPFGVPDGGRRATIVVECDGPAGMSGLPVRPIFSPDPIPERRSLDRLAGRNRRARRPETADI